MKLERKKNTIRSVSVGFGARICVLLTQFISRTVFLHILGIEYSGVNSLFTSILGTLSLSELGIGSILIFSMYKPIAEDDKATVWGLLDLYKKCYLYIGIIILFVGLAVTPLIPRFIHGEYPQELNLYTVYLINLTNTVVSYFLFAYKASILRAHQRNDVISMIDLTTDILRTVVQVFVLLFIRSYYIYLLILPICTIVRNLFILTASQALFPEYSNKEKAELESTVLKDIRKQVGGMLFHKMGNAIFLYADNIVISAFLGLSVLGKYNYYYYLITTGGAFVTIISNSLIPGIGNSLQTNSFERNKKDYAIVNMLYYWIATVGSTCLLCLYQPFMKLWVGEGNMFGFSTVLNLSILFFSLHVNSALGVFKGAVGMWWEDKFRPIVSAVFNLTMNIVLVSHIGINGVIISSFLANILIDFPYLAAIIARRCFHESLVKFICAQALQIIRAVPVMGLTYFVLHFFTMEGITGFIMRFFACVIVVNILFALINLRLSAFRMCLKQFRAMFVNPTPPEGSVTGSRRNS